MCAHIPGLKVVFPATPYDAKGLMYSALVGHRPGGLLREPAHLRRARSSSSPAACPTGYYEVPIGEPDVKKAGKDLTILTIGATLYRALEAAKALEEKYGLSCEVIDARSIVPFNYAKVLESVKKTRKILLASRRLRARQRPADHGRQDHAVRLRRAGRPAGGGGRAQLDHPGRRSGRRLLPLPRATFWTPCTSTSCRSRAIALPGSAPMPTCCAAAPKEFSAT